MAAIQLPDLVQRIRVKTDELRNADKALVRTGKGFDELRAKASDASDAMDELTDSTDRYNSSATRTENNASGVVKAIRMLDDASNDSAVSISRTADSTGGLRTEVMAVSDAVSGLGDNTDETSHSMDGLARSSNNLNRSFSLSDDRISSVNDSMTRLRTTIKETSSEQQKYKKDTDSSGNSTGAFVKKTLAAVGVLGLLKGAFLGLAFGVIIAGLGQIVSLLTSLAAGAIALTAALAPAAGALASLPAAILAVKSSTFVFKQIVGGASDAIKAIQDFGPASDEAAEALAALSGPTRRFAETFGQLQFIFNDIRNQMRRVALPAFSDAMEMLGPVVRATKDEFNGLAVIMGGLALKGAKMISSGPFSRDIQTILERNNQLVGIFGTAALKLVNILRNLMVAAGSMTRELAEMGLHFVKVIDNMVESGRESGRLQAFFRETVAVIKTVIRTLVDLGVGLFNIFSLGSKLGGDLLKSIRDGAESFREWTESASGRNAILEFFNNARPVITQSAKLIEALVKVFFDLNRETAKTTVAPLLKQLRTDLLPVLAELLITLSKSGLVSAVADLAREFVALINTMPFQPLIELTKGFATLLGWVVKLIQAVPGLGAVLATAALVFSGFKILKLVAGFVGLEKVLTRLSTVIRVLLVGALRALAVALVTTPVGWFILLFTGAMVGLKLLYDRTKWFHDLWDDGWQRAKTVVEAVVGFFTGTVGPAFAAAFRGIATAVTWVVDFIRDHWKLIVGFILGPVGVIVGAIVAVWSRIRSFLVANWAAIQFAAIRIWGVIGPYVTTVFQTIWKIATVVFPAIWKVVSTAFTAIWTVIRTVLGAIWTAIKGYWTIYGGIIIGTLKMIWAQVKFVFNVIAAVIKGVLGVIGAAFRLWWALYGRIVWRSLQAIWKIVKGVFKFIQAEIGGRLKAIWAIVKPIWNAIVRFITAALIWLVPRVRALMEFLYRTVVVPIGRIIGFVRRVWNLFYQYVVQPVQRAVAKVQELIDNIRGFFEGAWDWLYGAGQAIIEGFVEGIKSRFQWVEDAFNWVTDRIPDWKGPIGKDEKLLYDAGVAVMRGFEKGVTDKFKDVEHTLNEMTGKVQGTFDSVNGGGPSGDTAVRQLRTTNIAASVQRKLMAEAKKAAIEENRLRLKLPLLEGAARKKALQEIHRLEQQQADAIRRSGGVRAVTDLRKERQVALGRANRAATQAQELRSKLPGLEGEERRNALEKIRQLEETRAAELKKAKDVQTELIKVFRDLPAGVRKLLNEARRDRDEKIDEERAKDRRENRAGSGISGMGKFAKSPVGTSGDPVFTNLGKDADFGFKPGDFDNTRLGRDAGKTKDYAKDTVSNTKETARTVDKMGRRLAPLPESFSNVDANLDSLRREQRESAQDTRVSMRLGLDSNAKNIRAKIAEAKAEAATDAKKGRDQSAQDTRAIRQQDRSIGQANRARLADVRAGIADAGHADAFAIVDAINQTRTQRPTRPDLGGGGARGGKATGDPGANKGKNVTNNVTVHNPKPEASERSISKRLKLMELMGGAD